MGCVHSCKSSNAHPSGREGAPLSQTVEKDKDGGQEGAPLSRPIEKVEDGGREGAPLSRPVEKDKDGGREGAPLSRPVEKDKEGIIDQVYAHRLDFARQIYAAKASIANPNIGAQHVVVLTREDFLNMGRFQKFEHCNAMHLNAIDLPQSAHVLFVSHRWQDAAAGLPDSPDHAQHTVVACFLQSHPAGLQVTHVWTDYSNINQDRNTDEGLEGFFIRLDNIPTAVLLAHTVLVVPRLVEYRSKGILSDLHELCGRGWCLMEGITAIHGASKIFVAFVAGEISSVQFEEVEGGLDAGEPISLDSLYQSIKEGPSSFVGNPKRSYIPAVKRAIFPLAVDEDFLKTLRRWHGIWAFLSNKEEGAGVQNQSWSPAAETNTLPAGSTISRFSDRLDLVTQAQIGCPDTISLESINLVKVEDPQLCWHHFSIVTAAQINPKSSKILYISHVDPKIEDWHLEIIDSFLRSKQGTFTHVYAATDCCIDQFDFHLVEGTPLPECYKHKDSYYQEKELRNQSRMATEKQFVNVPTALAISHAVLVLPKRDDILKGTGVNKWTQEAMERAQCLLDVFSMAMPETDSQVFITTLSENDGACAQFELLEMTQSDGTGRIQSMDSLYAQVQHTHCFGTLDGRHEIYRPRPHKYFRHVEENFVVKGLKIWTLSLPEAAAANWTQAKDPGILMQWLHASIQSDYLEKRHRVPDAPGQDFLQLQAATLTLVTEQSADSPLVMKHYPKVGRLVSRQLPSFTAESDREIVTRLLCNVGVFFCTGFQEIVPATKAELRGLIPAINEGCRPELQKIVEFKRKDGTSESGSTTKTLLPCDLVCLFSVLPPNPLLILNLRCHLVGPYGVKAILTAAAAPGSKHQLSHLRLGGCFVGDAGAIALGEWLGAEGRGAKHLMFLDLEIDGVGPDGARALGMGLGAAVCTKLVALSLCNNHIGREGAAAVLAGWGRRNAANLVMDYHDNGHGDQGDEFYERTMASQRSWIRI